MIYFIFAIAIVFSILLNTMIPHVFGLPSIDTLSYLPLLCYFVIKAIKKEIRYNKDAIYIVLLAIIIFVFKMAVGQNYRSEVISLLFIPMLLSVCLESVTKKELTLARNAVICFFIAECGDRKSVV